MTEDEWLRSADPTALYAFARDATRSWRTRWAGWLSGKRFAVSERKMRLCLWACCARVAHLLPTAENRDCLDATLRHAEGKASEADLQRAVRRSMESKFPIWSADYQEQKAGESYAMQALSRVHRGQEGGSELTFRHAALAHAHHHFSTLNPSALHLSAPFLTTEHEQEVARQANLVRDIIGNPFRAPPRLDPLWLSANDDAVRRIAADVYERHAFDELPILGDALEEAGCTEGTILDHCRQGGLHARGCWLVDLILGKE